jgi:hypothetical protein
MNFKPLARKAALVLALAGVCAGTASASHSWNNYHWARNSASFTLITGPAASAEH